MSYQEYKKKQTQHMRCVICGHGYVANYDEQLGSFPVYHVQLKDQNPLDSCEHHLFKSILRLYDHLHRCKSSLTFVYLVTEYDWQDRVLLKKELLTWCLSVGYLALDSLRRIKIPDPLSEIAEDIFAQLRWDDEASVAKAVDMLRCALICYYEDLDKVTQKDMPVKMNIAEPKKPLEEVPPLLEKDAGMATVEWTGAIKFTKKRTRE